MKIYNLAILGVITLSGCYDPNYMQYHYPPPPPQGAIIPEAPPAPLVEVIPVIPYSGAIWVDGYWNWADQRYLWIAGRYMRPPRVGVAWYPGGYVRSGRGYSYMRGRWAPPHYRPRHRYVHRRAYQYPRGHRNYRQGQPRVQHPRYRRSPSRSRQYAPRTAPSRRYRGAPRGKYAPERSKRGAPSRRSYQKKKRKDRRSYSAPGKVRRSAPPKSSAPSKARKSAPPAR